MSQKVVCNKYSEHDSC